MIQPQPAPSPVRRFAILCPGFADERIRRQPWHTADGLAGDPEAFGQAVAVKLACAICACAQ